MLLAPLVVARKGFYTELAKWANARGYKHLRVDGEMLTTYQWPRLNRFKEHTIELPVAQIHVQKDNADTLERNVIKALDLGKGLLHVLDMDAKKPKVQVFSVKRACPSCGTSFAELDPRLFTTLAACAGIWCAFAFWLARHSPLAATLQRRMRFVLPFVLIAVGMYILSDTVTDVVTR